MQLQRTVTSTDAELPDELLYGRAGYLYALLYLNTEIGPDTVPQSVIKEVGRFSLQCHSISAVELESHLHVIQGIKRGRLQRRGTYNCRLSLILHSTLLPLSSCPVGTETEANAGGSTAGHLNASNMKVVEHLRVRNCYGKP